LQRTVWGCSAAPGVGGNCWQAGGHTATDGDFGVPATQQAVCEINTGCRVAAGGLDRIQTDELRRGRLFLSVVGAQAGRHFDIQLCGLQVAGKMRIEERACPCAVKISLAVERDRQRRRAGFAVTSQSRSRRTVSNSLRLLVWKSTLSAEGLAKGYAPRWPLASSWLAVD